MLETQQEIRHLFELRPYQAAQKADIYKSIRRGIKKILVQLPTGGGKTVLFSDIARDCAIKEKRVLILAHRTELIHQAAKKIYQTTGIRPGIIKAGVHPRLERLIQVGSVQTIYSRLDKLPQNFWGFGLVVIDECHRSVATSYQAILDRCLGPAVLLGFTATPVRSDGKGLGDCYDEIVAGISVRKLIEAGSLAPYKIFACDEDADALHPENAVAAYRRHSDGKQCIVFCSDVAHSKATAEAYAEAGYKAVHLDGFTSADDRRRAIEGFATGEIQILINCGLFIEGFDVPGIEVVQILRRVGSIAAYLQMLGRGLRPAPNKSHAIFLIHSDCHKIHGHPSDTRMWTLEGIETKEKTITKKKNNDDEFVMPEPEPVSAMFLEALLTNVTINRDEAEPYIIEIRRLIRHYGKLGKKPSYIYDLIIKLRPPIAGWYYYAEACGMGANWARTVNLHLISGIIHKAPLPK